MFKNRNLLYSLLVGLLALGFSLIPSRDLAALTTSSQVSIPVQASGTVDNYLGGLSVFGINGQIQIGMDKDFDLIRSNNNQLPQTSKISIGEKLRVVDSPSRGHYFFTGGFYNSPPLDNTEYSFPSLVPSLYIRGGIPRDIANYKITTSDPNVLVCNRQECVAKAAGTVQVTVSFPSIDLSEYSTTDNNNVENNVDGSILTEQIEQYRSIKFNQNDNWGYGYVEMFAIYRNSSAKPFTYSYPSLTYNITVRGNANRMPNVNYQSTKNIGTDRATGEWTYSDQDGDQQTEYQLQLATDRNYSNLVFNVSALGNVRAATITGLSRDTAYYPRVRARNAVNSWSQWSNGAPFRTLAIGSNEGIVTARPLVAYKENQNSILTSPPQIEAGGQVSLGWAVLQSTNASINGNDSNECRAISPNWSGSWRGSGWQGSGWHSTVVTVPNSLGIHTYSLECRGSAAWDNWLLNNLGVYLGYGRGITGFTVTNDGLNRGYSYQTSTDIEVIAPTIPEPNLRFRVNGQEDTLKVKSGQDLEFDWQVENSDSLSGCRAETVGPRQDIWTGDKTKTGGLEAGKAPVSSQTENYLFRLICDPIPFGRGVVEEVSVEVAPGLVVICRVGNQTVVNATPARIETEALNGSAPYTWELFEGKDPEVAQTRRNSNNGKETWEISYAGTRLGSKKPRIKVTDQNGAVAESSCREIINYGNRNLREINP